MRGCGRWPREWRIRGRERRNVYFLLVALREPVGREMWMDSLF
jgi:hypothetical protein